MLIRFYDTCSANKFIYDTEGLLYDILYVVVRRT